MKTTRRRFLAATAVTATGTILPNAFARVAADGALDAFQIAQRHRIVRDLPTPNFFEGMLLGNGDVGVCVTVRPDALGLHLGKEDSWDIRLSDDHSYQQALPLDELLDLWKRAGEEAKRQGKPDMLYLEYNIDFFRAYTKKVVAGRSHPWPRPWPCGSVWVHWDPRKVCVLRQVLDPSNGLFTLDLECDDGHSQHRKLTVCCFVNWTTGHVLVSSDGPAPFISVAYCPNLEVEQRLPAPEIDGGSSEGFAEFTAYQHFPATAPTKENPNPPRTEKDRNFTLCGRLQGKWAVEGLAESRERLRHLDSLNTLTFLPSEGPPCVFLRNQQKQPFRLDLTLITPRDHADNVAFAKQEVTRLAQIPAKQLQQETENHWKEFWSRSAVEFENRELERIWYHNQYLLACCLREGKVAPGLFGNWTSGKIGTPWHGDYHMNYNTQQVF